MHDFGYLPDSYSCRVGKGTLFGIERLEHHIRSVSQNYTRSCYVLKLDILGYFMSISRARLYEIVIEGIQGHAGDALYPYMVDLLGKVIFNDPVKGCRFKGVPFLGCVLKNGERMLTRRAHRLMTDRLDEVYTREENPYRVRAVVNSYRGHCCHFDTTRAGFQWRSTRRALAFSRNQVSRLKCRCRGFSISTARRSKPCMFAGPWALMSGVLSVRMQVLHCPKDWLSQK